MKPITSGTLSIRSVAGRCPHHGVALVELRQGSAVIRRCPPCGGIWIPGETVENVLGSLEKSQRLTQPGKLLCPDDRTPLSVLRHKGVTVDFCCRCSGVWLDRGELERIVRLKNRSSLLDSALEGADFVPEVSEVFSGAGEFAGEVVEAVLSGIGELFSGF